MKPDDSLKTQKVRCVKAYSDCLTVGKEYSVLDIHTEVKVKDDEGAFLYWESDHFKPVIESAENPLQNIELTPEFEAAEPVIADISVNTQDNSVNIQDNSVNIQDTPKFKVGDRHSRAKEIKDEIIGRTYKSKNFGLFTVTDYQNSKNVFIRFNDTGYEVKTSLKSVIEGGIKDKLSPTVYGVGILGDKYPTKIKGERLKEYALWYEMLKRCYSENRHKKQPTYSQCKASENFKKYSYFYEWCQTQIGFNNTGWCLDKDLLVRGNKTYSESNCVFIPEKINNALIKSDKARGLYPIGVCIDGESGNFYAQVNNGSGCQVNLGRFTDPISAFNAYKEAKERYLAELAEQYKEQIDPRAYEALLNYEVSIDD